MQEQVLTKCYPPYASTNIPPNQAVRNLTLALLFLDVAQADFSPNSENWCDVEILKHLLAQTHDKIKAEYDKVASIV